MGAKIQVITNESRFLNVRSYWCFSLAQFLQITKAALTPEKRGFFCATALLKDFVSTNHPEWQLSHPLDFFCALFSPCPVTTPGNHNQTRSTWAGTNLHFPQQCIFSLLTWLPLALQKLKTMRKTLIFRTATCRAGGKKLFSEASHL